MIGELVLVAVPHIWLCRETIDLVVIRVCSLALSVRLVDQFVDLVACQRREMFFPELQLVKTLGVVELVVIRPANGDHTEAAPLRNR
jgi:hypothetical protein